MCLQETLENVKKCRNFLSTLIKLASSGKQSSETIANVKELVKNLLVHSSHPAFKTSSFSVIPGGFLNFLFCPLCLLGNRKRR